jgi:hypothetical protein
MRTKVAVVAVVLLLISPLAHAQPGSTPTPAKTADVQMAVEKGLFFVEHKSVEWWKTEKCATCHEGQILLVAANVAKDQGIPVDQEKLDFWTDRWVLVDALIDYKDGRLNGLGIPTAPFALLHRDRDRDRDRSEARAKRWAEALRILFQSQGDDGSWTPKAAFVDITPRMALALVDLETSEIPFSPELRREITERRKQTEDWIKTHEPQLPEKTESLAGWVDYEHQRGEPERAKKLLDELLSRRRDDGGWGIKKDAPSHLLITSVVLLALKTSGLPNDNPVVIDTQQFLLSKQSEDGRWRELGRHFHPDQYHTAYDTWTTGYAVAALSLTMPKLGPNATRLFTPAPELVAEVEQLTQAAAKDYQGQPDRTGDPTQTEPPEKYR